MSPIGSVNFGPRGSTALGFGGHAHRAFPSAAITVFQGIETVLNNKPQDIPMNKKLHIANGFLSSIVKATIENKDTKRGITITSTLIDLVIDFFTGE